jgi:DNA-binding transcriptional MerR regulator
MFTIGDFARHGRVSVRMLRHYDAIGLLRPARTDPVSGYRFYEAGQLARLNRVIALKDLGFTLEQVRSILDERLGTEELRGMLRLRRAELEDAVAAATARLARVEARLRTIESEGRMPTEDIVVRSIPPVRVAELTGIADGFGPEHIGPVVQPLYDELCRRLERAGVEPAGPGIAWYEDAPGGGGAVVVHAGVTVASGAGGERTSRSWTCPASSRRPPSSTAAPWTASCPPPRPWPAGSTPRATARPATRGSCTWSARRTGRSG